MEQQALIHAIFNLYNAMVLFVGAGITIWFAISYKKTKSRQLLTSLPGIFTSLGLLGTFLSIVITLGGIKADDFSTTNEPTALEISIDDTQDSSEAQITEEAIDSENGVKTAGNAKTPSGTDKTIDIISGLVPAFTSSILGLILAFMATVVTKLVFAKEDAQIDSKVNNVTPKESLYNISSLLESLKDKTEEYNRQMQENINVQNEILKKYLQGFEEKLDTVFEHMKSSITDQVQSICSEQMIKAENMLTKISESLGKVTQDILESQKTSVQGLVDVTNSQLKEMASSVAGQYSLIQQNAAENVAAMTALKEQYAKANEGMLQQAVEMNKQATSDMRDSLEGFVSKISESVNTECNQLHSSLESNVKALEKAYSFVKDRIAQITADYDQASLAYRDAVSVAHRQNESSENVIKKANESLTLLKETNRQIGALLDAFNDRQDNIETLVSHINEMSSTIESLQRLESQLKRLGR